MKQKIFIDTDCGMDDIIAISMLASDENILIKGITTVRGLTDPSTGMNNLEAILKFLGKKINISAGSKYPLKLVRRKNMFPKQDIINSSKLSFLTELIGNSKKSQGKSDKFNKFIYRAICEDKKKTTILCLGPLTNIAKVINQYGSKFTKKIDKLVIMGGAVFTPGNVSLSKKAEYNFYLDPEAARMVLQSGIPIILVPIDSAKFVPATKYLKDKISRKKPKMKTGKLIQKIIVANRKDFQFFYDPLAASILIDPKIILDTKQIGLTVNSQGQSLTTKRSDKINLITKVSRNKFNALLYRKLE